MTDGQVRVRISVTVTRNGKKAYRSSLVERIENTGSTQRLYSWSMTETPALVYAALQATESSVPA